MVIGMAVSFAIETLTADSEAATNLSNAAVTFSMAAVPIATGIAILRHRLYDIDLIINRTLVYGALTAILGLSYFTIVGGISSLVGESSLTVAAATLAVAALFQPLRRRVQSFIDQRFYRNKYDAAKTLELFNARLRDEIDLAILTRELVAVVNETMQPAHVSLWLREGAGELVRE
ncbi:MAG: hypothetical protein ABR529_12130 [Actinomycetota bacterium]